METTDHPRPMTLLPATKGQRMLRLKDAWEKLGQAERTSAVELDVQRATLLAEELAEPTSDEPIREKDLAQVTGINPAYIGQLLRYHRFRSFCIALNFAIAKIEITEGRFRAYWKELSDPQTMKSLTRNTIEKHAYEQRVFLVISQYLEAGKPPPKTPKAVQPATVEAMHTKKDPVRALRKENAPMAEPHDPYAAYCLDGTVVMCATCAQLMMTMACLTCRALFRSCSCRTLPTLCPACEVLVHSYGPCTL